MSRSVSDAGPNGPLTGPLTVVGNPENRRVTAFLAAAETYRIPTRVLPWSQVLTGQLPDRLGLVRVESPGEHAEVDRQLRVLGGGDDRRLDHGEIGDLAAWYAGLIRSSRRLAQTDGADLDTSVDDLAVLFDKRLTRERLIAAEVAVPAGGPPADELLDTPGRWFVKPAHGSSASGVLAVEVARGRVRATGPVERVGGQLFNTLRLRTMTDRGEVSTLLGLLGRTGPLVTERWFSKAGLAGRSLDLRVVVIDGTARHVVVRTSRSPITNLHLGNRRGDLAAVRDRLGADGWARVYRLAEQAAACFPATLTVGVDLMIQAQWNTFAVAEVNAFGDLLPRVLVDGRDTYQWQAAAYAERLASAVRS